MESLEQQAITTSSYKPRIWKRYVDDTLTILDRANVDSFLQHLNNQQPSLRFTMETENDYKLAFLDTAVSRETDGRLTTAKRLVTKPSVISKEKKHLSSVRVSNGYPLSFLQKITKTRKPSSSAKPTTEYKSTAVLPFVKGLSEKLRPCLQQQGIRAVFESQTTLRSPSTTEKRCRSGETRWLGLQDSMRMR